MDTLKEIAAYIGINSKKAMITVEFYIFVENIIYEVLLPSEMCATGISRFYGIQFSVY